MFLSKYFLPIVKDTPKDAQIISHRLMLRSGMIKARLSRYLFLVTTWPESFKENFFNYSK